MNREQYQRLEQLEELLERSDKRMSEQTSTFGQMFSALTDTYEGDGADEMSEMHQQIIARLTVYEEQLRLVLKETKAMLSDGYGGHDES